MKNKTEEKKECKCVCCESDHYCPCCNCDGSGNPSSVSSEWEEKAREEINSIEAYNYSDTTNRIINDIKKHILNDILSLEELKEEDTDDYGQGRARDDLRKSIKSKLKEYFGEEGGK